jgi:Holliday junction DNA helicase RuvA
VIAYVDGTVAEVSETTVVLEVGGVGIELLAPTATLAKCVKGQRITLRTQLIVRDEQPTLYGFHHHDQITVFRRLLDVTGVGPKVALSVLSTLPVPLIATAVGNQDPGLLTSVPGVGKRIAERIVLELRDRLPEELMAGAGAPQGRRLLEGAGEDAVAALLALGYREGQVKGVVAELAGANPEDGAETLIRKALARLR